MYERLVSCDMIGGVSVTLWENLPSSTSGYRRGL